MLRIGLAVFAALLMAASVDAQIVLYQNDMSESDWSPPGGGTNRPEWSDKTGGVCMDGGIPGSHGGNGTTTGLGRLNIGTEPGTGITLSWDDSPVNYSTDVVTVSFWVSHEFATQPSVSGR